MAQAVEDDEPTFREQRAAHLTKEGDLPKYRELDTDGVFDLTQQETWWSEHYEFLLSRGYKLRRRFRPGWKPSWNDTNLNPFFCEDAYRHNVSYHISHAAATPLTSEIFSPGLSWMRNAYQTVLLWH